VLREEHLNTLVSIGNLASIYRSIRAVKGGQRDRDKLEGA